MADETTEVQDGLENVAAARLTISLRVRIPHPKNF